VIKKLYFIFNIKAKDDEEFLGLKMIKGKNSVYRRKCKYCS
jgi:hypothetical protein